MLPRLIINRTTGLLEEVPYLPSPHCDNRPPDASVSLIVVHGISLPPAIFTGTAIADFFQGNLDSNAHPYFKTIKEARVSAHLLIRRDGSISQFVPFEKRAWHAGASTHEEQACCNDFSIGIELEGTDDIPYEKHQYESLAAVILALMQVYTAITPQRIVGHSDIAPGRKTDPGPSFDWAELRKLIAL